MQSEHCVEAKWNCVFCFHVSVSGGSDDGLNCAVMLEVLEALSRSETSLKHNVIFLFNGAEESPLQVGSHAWDRKLWSQHWFANYINTCNVRYQLLTGSSRFWEVHQQGTFPLRAEVEPVFKMLCLGSTLEMEEAQKKSVWKSYSFIKTLNAEVLEIFSSFVIRSGDWSDSLKV